MKKSPLQCVSLLSSRKKLLLFLPLLLLLAVNVRRQNKWYATQDASLINISNKAHSFPTAAAVIPAGSSPSEFSPGLDALVQSRCERFSRKSNSKSPSSNSNIHQTEGHSSTDGGGTLALVHVQKSGGNSFEDMLVQQANRSGKTVNKTYFCLRLCSGRKGAGGKKCFITDKKKIGNSWKAFLPKDNNNSTASNECVRSLLKDADILVGHQDFSYVEDDIRWKSENITNSASKPDWITLIRNPSDKIESAYKWEQQRKRLKGINRTDKISFQTNFDKFIHTTGSINNALRMHAPLDVYKLLIEDNKPHVAFDRVFNNNFAFDKLEPEIQMDVLEKVAMNIANRFSAVGVLDRLDESLEVLRCRHPWIDATTLPHSNPSKMKFPHKLVRNDTLIREVAMADDYLYTFANRLLSIDVECCRRSR